MNDFNINNKKLWEFVELDSNSSEIIQRKSLTFFQDVMSRFIRNKVAVVSLFIILIILLGAIFIPYFWKFEYSDQNLDFTNIPNKLEIYKINEDTVFYVTSDFNVIKCSEDGKLLEKAELVKSDMVMRKKYFEIDGNAVIVDYGKYYREMQKLNNQAATMDSDEFTKKKSELDNAPKFSVTYQNKEIEPYKTVRNKTYVFGSDNLGRDLFIRVVYGARISLAVGFAAAIICLIVGVFYGGIAGYMGGRVDNIMMRIVDIISTIPTLLYVILLSVLFDSGGLFTIIFTIGLTYWVGMARLVRGQVLSLKEQEFVLAAKSLGASTSEILISHLIPNIMGPVMVSLTMQIPSAIFTEAFLSFIGLGISAPMASWGTLCNDALQGLYTNPYQLLFPAAAISITILAFNLLGDGLRDALDPKLRK